MLSPFMSVRLVRHFFFNSIFFFIACLFLGCGLNGGSVQAQTIGQPSSQTTIPTPDRLSLDDRLATQHRIHAILASQPVAPARDVKSVSLPLSVEAEVTRHLLYSQILTEIFNAPLTAEQLHRELERWRARPSEQAIVPGIEEALEFDQVRLEECIARPALTEKFLKLRFRLAVKTNPAAFAGQDFDGWIQVLASQLESKTQSPPEPGLNSGAEATTRQATREFIVNGGFESGEAPWLFDGAIRSGIRRSGNFSAALGILNDAADEVSQQITLPSTIGTAQLSFYANLTSDEPASSTRDDDVFGIVLLTTTGEIIETLDAWSNRDQQSLGNFTLRGPYNVIAYRGRTLRVAFLGFTDVALPSDFRVDDVTLRGQDNNFDFTLTISPTTQSVAPGGTATYTLGIQTTGSLPDTVLISSSNLPPDSTFQSNFGQFPFPFRIVTSTSTPIRTYNFTITGTVGNVRRSTTATLIVQQTQPDFSLFLSSTSQTTAAGGSATYTLGRTNTGGFSGNVQVTAQNLPPGTSFDIPSSFTFPVSFSLRTSTTTPTGTYSFTIVGTSGGLTRSVQGTLHVTPPADSVSPTVRLLAPNGGEKVKRGRSYTIQWQSSDNLGVISQDISLSVDGGANFLVTVATGLSGNTQSFVFTPSSTLGKSKTSRIRVIARDQAGNAGIDTSDGNFKLK